MKELIIFLYDRGIRFVYNGSDDKTENLMIYKLDQEKMSDVTKICESENLTLNFSSVITISGEIEN